MEGAAFYRILEDEKISGLLVKGVCDYADSEKDNSYHQYASEVSAAYILCFIQGTSLPNLNQVIMMKLTA
ncbi:MAG: hypothetical protein U1F76_30745 [Candidatus Competibacteraceae bacterium]